MEMKEIIKRHLDQVAKQDFAFAERYKLESKNLDACCKYIITQAKKHAKQNCAFVENDVVYGWAIHYYMEDNVKVDENIKAKVSTPKDIKPVKALVKDKKENKCVQLDLFGGF